MSSDGATIPAMPSGGSNSVENAQLIVDQSSLAQREHAGDTAELAPSSRSCLPLLIFAVWLKAAKVRSCNVGRRVWESGVLSMTVAAIMFSLSALCIKEIQGRIPTFEIVVARSSLSFIACVIVARQANVTPLFGRFQNLPALLARGLLGTAGWDHKRALGTGFGLISAMCAAGTFISIRIIGKKEQPLTMSVYFHVCAFITSVIPLSAGVMGQAVNPSLPEAFLLLGVAATSFFGQILLGRGFQLLTAAKASAINFSQIVYSYIFSVTLLHESLSLLGMAGSLLVAAGVVLVNVKPAKKPVSVPNVDSSNNSSKDKYSSSAPSSVSLVEPSDPEKGSLFQDNKDAALLRRVPPAVTDDNMKVEMLPLLAVQIDNNTAATVKPAAAVQPQRHSAGGARSSTDISASQ